MTPTIYPRPGVDGATGATGPAGPDNVLVGAAVPSFGGGDSGKGLLWDGSAWTKAALATIAALASEATSRSDADVTLSNALAAEVTTRSAADASINTALLTKADLVAGVIPSSQLPALATGEVVSVASQAAMLALTAAQVQQGDIAIRTDQSGHRWLLADDDPSMLTHWIPLETPDGVSSVNGQVGAVVLGYTDVGAASPADVAAAVATEATNRTNADNTLTTNLGNEVTRATNAEALLAPLSSPALTGNPTAPTQAAGNSSTRLSTTAYADAAVGVEAAARTAAIALKLSIANNLSDLANAATARTNLGLGTAATQASSAFDAAGAASSEQTRALAAEALLAPLASPALTGNPTVPTQTALNNSTRAASTAYADAAVGVEAARATAAEALLAPSSTVTANLAASVILAPGASTRNVIQPSGNFIPLVVKNNAAQAVNLTEWQTSGSVALLSVLPGGELLMDVSGTTASSPKGIGFSAPSASNSWVVGGKSGTQYFDGIQGGTGRNFQIASYYTTEIWGATSSNMAATAGFVGSSGSTVGTSIRNTTVGAIALVVRGAASQSANLQEWQSSGAVALASIGASGSATLSDTLTVAAATSTVILNRASGDPNIAMQTGGTTIGMIRANSGSATIYVSNAPANGTSVKMATAATAAAGLAVTPLGASQLVSSVIGWTSNYTVTNKSLTSNVATLTTSITHAAVVGRQVVVSGVDATFNGTYTITAVTSTTISYAKVNADIASVVATGSAQTPTQISDLDQWQDGLGNVRALISADGKLVARAMAGGSANIQEWQSFTGTALASMSATGVLTAGSFSGGLSTSGDVRAGRFLDQVNTAYINTTASNGWALISANTGKVPLSVQGQSGQTSDLQRWVTSANVTLGSIAADGASDLATTLTGRLRLNSTGTGLNGNAPVAKASAITSPTSDTVGTKAAIDAIITALHNIGITA